MVKRRLRKLGFLFVLLTLFTTSLVIIASIKNYSEKEELYYQLGHKIKDLRQNSNIYCSINDSKIAEADIQISEVNFQHGLNIQKFNLEEKRKAKLLSEENYLAVLQKYDLALTLETRARFAERLIRDEVILQAAFEKGYIVTYAEAKQEALNQLNKAAKYDYTLFSCLEAQAKGMNMSYTEMLNLEIIPFYQKSLLRGRLVEDFLNELRVKYSDNSLSITSEKVIEEFKIYYDALLKKAIVEER